MVNQPSPVKVILGSNPFSPRAFRWQGRTVRVLAVESIKTFGAERRYRVRTGEGYFELGCFGDAGAWRLHRAPTWLGRLWARWQDVPRYPVPVWRRRVRRMVVRQEPLRTYRPRLAVSPA